ncbi:Very-long-chain [Sparganum proliferum]
MYRFEELEKECPRLTQRFHYNTRPEHLMMSLLSGPYHPSTLWSQDAGKIFLNIALSTEKEPFIETEHNLLNFETTGTGANGQGLYGFRLDLFENVREHETDLTVTDQGIRIVLKKESPKIWPRLTASKERLPWLRTDFNRLSSKVLSEMFGEDFADDSDNEQKVTVDYVKPTPEQQMRHNEEIARANAQEDWKEVKNLMSNPLVVYLLIYNIFQWAGYVFVFGTLLSSWWTKGGDVKSEAYALVADRLLIVQLASFLEIVHVVMGWVRSSTLATTLQVLGRNLVFFLILVPHKEVQEDTAVFILFLVWSMIELFRYPYYLLRIFDEEFGLLTYLRYTAWIPLYPIGFMCEGKLIILAMPLLEQSRKFCLDLPNPWNVSFDFPLFLHVYFLAMLPAFGLLMKRMYLQRRRILTPRIPLRSTRPRSSKPCLASGGNYTTKEALKQQ